jgi:hypothetical protein
MARNEIYFPPEAPAAAARFWRDRATKLEAEVAELKAALARKQAIDEGGEWLDRTKSVQTTRSSGSVVSV